MRTRALTFLTTCSLSALALSLTACGGDDGGSTNLGGAGGTAAASGAGGTTGGTGGTGGTTGGTGGTTGGTGGTTGGTGGTTGGTGGTGTDADGDGYSPPEDCDDSNPAVNPGASEICNGIDDNCDGQTDEGVTTTFYVDADGDNFGVDDAASNIQECTVPTGYASVAGDCADNDALSFPGNPEVCDGKDNDCANGIDDGVTLTTYYQDLDGDGYGGTTTQDACTAPGANWVTQGGDCADNDKDRFPGNPEICDGKDNDCNAATPEPGQTTYYQDSDGDGYGGTVTQTACGGPPAGYVSQGGDCDDKNKAINPGAIELCDNIDNNCINGIDEGPTATWPDADGDGYGDKNGTVQYLCAVKPGRADNNNDCDDKNKAINPGATEIPGNGIDENCDGVDTAAGTQCGNDSLSGTSFPYVYAGFLGAGDLTSGGPMGTGFYWDDVEISTTAGQTLSIFYGRRSSSTITPRLYTRGPNSCTAGALTSFAYSNGNPAGSYKTKRVLTNTSAGYYYNPLTTATAGQTGDYLYEVLPGNVGNSCGSLDFELWPYGWRLVDSLLSTDDPPAASPVAAGYKTVDVETYLRANQTYTILQGGSSYTDRVYLSRAGACGTSVGSSSSGILNGGARLVYTPTQAGVYAAWASSLISGQTGAFSLNVVQGNVGESCFTGAGSQGGTGDAYVLWPLGGTNTQSLAIGDRAGDFGTTFMDDFETHMEYGEKISVTVTRTTGTYTPRIRITRAGACTTSLAISPQLTGAVGSLTYNITQAGIYVITVSSVQSSGTGNYTITTSY